MMMMNNYVELIEGWLHVWEPVGEHEEALFSHGLRPAPRWVPRLCVFRSDTAVFTLFESEQIWTSEYEKEFPDVGHQTVRTRLDGGVGCFHSRWGYKVAKKTVVADSEEFRPSDSEDERGSTASTPTSVRPLDSSRKSSTDSSHHSSNSSRRGSVLQESTRTESMESVSTTVWLVNFFIKKGFGNNQKSTAKAERKSSGSGLVDLSRALLNSKDKSARSCESVLASGPGMRSIDLSAPNVEVKPLHSSVLGQSHCIQVATPQGSKYISCTTSEEMDKWLSNIRRTTHPQDEHCRRFDSSLKIWIVEAKNISPKKRYFCDILLDQTLYAKTSIKTMTDMLFWGEHFELIQLPPVELITVNLYREADKKKKKDKNMLVGYINLQMEDLENRQLTEKWITCQSGTVGKAGKEIKSEIPIIRIKARKQTVDILPIEYYQAFVKYLRTDYKELCRIFEPLLAVKEKEDFATSLVHILQTQGKACEFLADIVIEEISRLDDEHLTFRGNSIATKAVEAFMKLVGGKYLYNTLGDLINQLVQSSDDCEVDPTKVATPQLLSCQQKNLDMYSNMAWVKIINSFCFFPNELREVFSSFRCRCTDQGKGDYSDNLISGCIFLRFLCPAILYPSLFNLTQEYPNERASRNLTLIAKTIQTLANFTQFGIKEEYMTFMNAFVEREEPHMKSFLLKISSGDSSNHFLEFDGHIDLGKELSVLHALLQECIAKHSATAGDQFEELNKILSPLTDSFADPTIGHSRAARKSQAYDNLVPLTLHSPETPPTNFRDTVISLGKINKRSFLSPSDALTDLSSRGQSPDTLSASEATDKSPNSASAATDKSPNSAQRKFRTSLETAVGFPATRERGISSNASLRKFTVSLDSSQKCMSLGDNGNLFENSQGKINRGSSNATSTGEIHFSASAVDLRNISAVRPNQINIDGPTTKPRTRGLSSSETGNGDYVDLMHITLSGSQAPHRSGIPQTDPQPGHPLAFANPLFGHLQLGQTRQTGFGALGSDINLEAHVGHAQTVQRASSDSSNSDSDEEDTPWQVKLAKTSSPLAESSAYMSLDAFEQMSPFESLCSNDSGQSESSFSNSSFYTCSSDFTQSTYTSLSSPLSPTKPSFSDFDGAINGCSTFPRRQRVQHDATIVDDARISPRLQSKSRNILPEDTRNQSKSPQTSIPFNRQFSIPSQGNAHRDSGSTPSSEATTIPVHAQQRNISGVRSVPEGMSTAVHRINQLRSLTDHLRSISSQHTQSPRNAAFSKGKTEFPNNLSREVQQSPDSRTPIGSQINDGNKHNTQTTTTTPERPDKIIERAGNVPPSSITKSPGWQIALKLTRSNREQDARSSRDSSPGSLESSPRNSSSSISKSSAGTINSLTSTTQPYDSTSFPTNSSSSANIYSKPSALNEQNPLLRVLPSSRTSNESPPNSRGSSIITSQNQIKLDISSQSPIKSHLTASNRPSLAEAGKKSFSFDSSPLSQPPAFLISKYAVVRPHTASPNQRLDSSKAASFHASSEATKKFETKYSRPFTATRSLDLELKYQPSTDTPVGAGYSEPVPKEQPGAKSPTQPGFERFSAPATSASCNSLIPNRADSTDNLCQHSPDGGINSVMRKLQEQERTKQEFEKEAHVLRQQLLEAQQKLHQTELRLLDNDMDTQTLLDECQNKLVESEETMRRQQAETDECMNTIIDRLHIAEEELKREHEEMVKVVEHKQQVIDVQELRIKNLDHANRRLLQALADLQGRESTEAGGNLSANCNGVTGNDDFSES